MSEIPSLAEIRRKMARLELRIFDACSRLGIRADVDGAQSLDNQLAGKLRARLQKLKSEVSRLGRKREELDTLYRADSAAHSRAVSELAERTLERQLRVFRRQMHEESIAKNQALRREIQTIRDEISRVGELEAELNTLKDKQDKGELSPAELTRAHANRRKIVSYYAARKSRSERLARATSNLRDLESASPAQISGVELRNLEAAANTNAHAAIREPDNSSLNGMNDQYDKLQSDLATLKKSLADAKEFFELEKLLPLAEENDREEKRLKDLTLRVSSTMCDLVFSTNFIPKGPRPKLTREDYELCGAWANQTRSACQAFDALTSRIGTYKSMRLVSARAAELFLINGFRKLGFDVIDVSIGQLSKGRSWRTHDIEVSGHSVDVKNARRSISTPNSYSEFCVPEFKKNRVTGEEVSIAAVLSDFEKDDSVNRRGEAKVTYLGNTSASTLMLLQRIASSESEGRLEIGPFSSHTTPGWVFEYPDCFYENRRRAINGINEILRHPDVPRVTLPSFLYPFSSHWPSREPLPGGTELAELVRRVGKHTEYSRPGAVLAGLIHFVNSACGEGEFDVQSLYALMLPPTTAAISMALKVNVALTNKRGSMRRMTETQTMFPFGRLDLEKYFVTFMEALNTAWGYCGRVARPFSQFRIVNASILQGKVGSGGRWKTLIAYCGGKYQSGPFKGVLCGNSPLVAGNHDWCGCGKLICDKCGYCSHHCEQRRERQARTG